MQELKAVVERISSFKEVAAILLFGSCAKGRATRLSDIDICVVLKKKSKELKARIEALSNEKVQISFFDEVPYAVRFRILKEGKLLFLRDELFFNHIKSQTISMFLDYRRILDNYYRKVFGWRYEI